MEIDALCSEIHSSVSADEPTTCITEAFFTLRTCIKYCLCGTTEYIVVLYGRSRSMLVRSDYGLGPGRRSIFALGPLLFFLLKEPLRPSPARQLVELNALVAAVGYHEEIVPRSHHPREPDEERRVHAQHSCHVAGYHLRRLFRVSHALQNIYVCILKEIIRVH